MIDQREPEEAQAAVDKVAPAVRAQIAELEVPWSVCRTGLEVVEPENPFQPFHVLLERFGGREHMVIAVPGATSRSEAVRMAADHCRAAQLAYERAVTDVLKAHGAYELLNKLNRLKKACKDANRVIVLGPAPKPERAPEGHCGRFWCLVAIALQWKGF